MSTPLETLFEELRDNLFRNYLFYIPSTLVEEAPLTAEQKTHLVPLLDYILFIDTDLNLYTYKQQPLQFKIYQKQDLLNANTFKLFTQKEIRKPFQFDFIIKEYTKYLEFNRVATNWLLQHLDVYLPNTTTEVKTVLQLQHANFKKHQQDIDQQLLQDKALPKEDMNLLEFVANNFKDLNHKLSAIQITNPVATTVATTVGSAVENEESATNSKHTKIKKEKRPLITDDEARKYLLKTVFNFKK